MVALHSEYNSVLVVSMYSSVLSQWPFNTLHPLTDSSSQFRCSLVVSNCQEIYNSLNTYDNVLKKSIPPRGLKRGLLSLHASHCISCLGIHWFMLFRLFIYRSTFCKHAQLRLLGLLSLFNRVTDLFSEFSRNSSKDGRPKQPYLQDVWNEVSGYDGFKGETSGKARYRSTAIYAGSLQQPGWGRELHYHQSSVQRFCDYGEYSEIFLSRR